MRDSGGPCSTISTEVMLPWCSATTPVSWCITPGPDCVRTIKPIAWAMLGQNAHSLRNALKDVQRAVEHLAGMRCGDDGTDARLALGHGGETDASGIQPLVEQLAREAVGGGRLADHNWRNRSLARAGVESEPGQLALEVPRVLPQPLNA